MVARGLAPTRARARDAILRGCVTVDGAAADRPGSRTDANATIEVEDPAGAYVSRAALKLKAGLDRFGYEPNGRAAIDIGASTGGFTQVLLERGARAVTAVDVGHGQLHANVAADTRVREMSGFNARELTAADLDEAIEALVADVSFIPLRLAIAPAVTLATPGAWAIVLVKPQFEVGRDGLGKGGIVRDPALAEAAVAEIADWFRGEGWTVDGIAPSPIAGGDGNAEFLLGARKPA